MENQMPTALQRTFDVLHSDLCALWVRWITHRQLFRIDEERISLLNRCAPSFFGLLQTILLDDMLSGLARITDRAATCGKQNATLHQLHSQIDEVQYPSLVAILLPKLENIDAICEPIRTIRMKRIAHRDYNVAIEPDQNRLPNAPYPLINTALEAVSDYLNRFQISFTNNHIMYSETITALGDAASLMSCLRFADEHRQRRMSQLINML